MTKQLSQHIVLIGFMGAGKSTVGKELANQIQYTFLDLDKEIEKSEGKSIPEIFALKGESYFREKEAVSLRALLSDTVPSVISTGGGVILLEKNREMLKYYPTILLNASIEEIYHRVSQQQGRPLLETGDDLKTRIADLYHQRDSMYKKVADFVIETDKKNINEIVDLIRSILHTPV